MDTPTLTTFIYSLHALPMYTLLISDSLNTQHSIHRLDLCFLYCLYSSYMLTDPVPTLDLLTSTCPCFICGYFLKCRVDGEQRRRPRRGQKYANKDSISISVKDG